MMFVQSVADFLILHVLFSTPDIQVQVQVLIGHVFLIMIVLWMML